MPYQFVITNVGRAAIVNAAHTGAGPVVISEIALGSGSTAATAARTSLAAEVKRITAIGGGVVAADTIHVAGSDTSNAVYTVREIGLYSNTGVLMAIYSQADPILTKAAGTVAMIAADLVITALPPGSITVGDVSFEYPQATETVKGVAEIATEAETLDGIDDQRIVTPKKLAAVIGTTLRRGLVMLASPLETLIGLDNSKAVTPAGLAGVTATSSRRGLIEIATNAEAAAGADTERALTPSHLGPIASEIFKMMYPVGEMLITRRDGNPSTWLGFGTWERYGAGRVPVGFSASDTDFDALDKTGGAKTITLSANEIPSHTHTIGPFTDVATSSAGAHSHFVASEGEGTPGSPALTATNHIRAMSNSGGSESRYGFGGVTTSPSKGLTTTSGGHTHTITIPQNNSGATGGGGAHSNVQPYIVVFMWRRTA